MVRKFSTWLRAGMFLQYMYTRKVVELFGNMYENTFILLWRRLNQRCNLGERIMYIWKRALYMTLC